ncbi:alpha/beta hydrolase [Nonomuraea angiospora]|uniref:alpha/beta hydrolase n=1 Tax=Nonomuraea angiospora TaxID=46172 RepID=UPI0029BC79DB|nr:alpha/beta hydrolase [Nonomuraea angiospora]MDX3108660.1 alpha/beta hydrolase [Nonomuraea angiospora]
MPVDPLIAPLLAAVNARQEQVPLDVAERRAARSGDYSGFVEDEPAVAEIWEEKIPGPDITVRIYRPAASTRGAMVLYHGGGWWMGSPDDSDRRARAIAGRAGVVVVNVDYRLAPEFPFPTPAEDAYAALAWTVAQAGRLGFDPARVAVGGESAGGNLAAAVCLLARERGGPVPVLQVLEIPALDLTLGSPSVKTYGQGYVLPEEELRWCVRTYLGDHDPADPVASPLHAADLTGLPPAVILTAECDPLADDGRLYADRLAAAGVPVTFREFAGHVHGSHTLTRLLPSAREWRAAVVDAVVSHA